jgi:Phosphotransferase enzyme family
VASATIHGSFPGDRDAPSTFTGCEPGSAAAACNTTVAPTARSPAMTKNLSERDAAEVDRQTASIRRVDARFVAPLHVRSAVVLGDLEGWREGLEIVGVDVRASGKADLAVTTRDRVDQAAATGAEMVAVEGGGARDLARAGFVVSRYLPRPRLDHPTLLVALDHPDAARYAALYASGSRSGWKAMRNQLAAELLKRRLVTREKRELTVGLQRPGPPLVVAAATDYGVPRDAQWFLSLGRGDQLSRNVFHLFETGSAEPSWVLKFVRVPGYRDPFDRDEHGLRLAQATPAAAAHAPRLVGRFEAAGIDASLETAARGESLLRLLASNVPRKDRLRRIDAIAGWIVDLGAQTLADPAALNPERQRLLRDVIPHWTDRGATRTLVDSLPEVRPVLQHNDLGSWNILVDETSFTAVDWESARAHGLPLWDLAYFLTDVLASLGEPPEDGWDEWFVRLYSGELPQSDVLFRWIRRAVDAAAVPADAVGPILTLGWLHHALSHVHRGAALQRAKAIGYSSPPRLERVAARWLETPGLGPSWSQWQRG